MKMLVVKRNLRTGLIDRAYLAISGGTHEPAGLGEAVKNFNRERKTERQTHGDRTAILSEVAFDFFDLFLVEVLDPDHGVGNIGRLTASSVCTEAGETDDFQVHRFFFAPHPFTPLLDRE